MQLGDIMTRDVEVIDMDASLREAAAKMARLPIYSSPIFMFDLSRHSRMQSRTSPI